MQDAIFAALTIGLFLAGVFVMRRFGRMVGYSLSSLGFREPRGGALTGAVTGFLVGIGAIVVEAITNPLSAKVLRHFGYSARSKIQQPFMHGLEGWVQQRPDLAIPTMILVVVLFGPAVEELVFRGAIFNGLYRLGLLVSTRLAAKGSGRVAGRIPFVLAALISSVLFALVHLEPVLFLTIFVLAIALCVLFSRSGSLLPSFVAHATFNTLPTVVIILDGLNVIHIPV